MIFASPLWLIALVPWAALVIWALAGQPEKSYVPFIKLWQAPAEPWPKPKRGWRAPPVSVIALLAAILLAILAAARPMLSRGARSTDVTVIVDRGIYSPYANSAADLRSVLRRDIPDASVNLRIVPQADHTSPGDWCEQVLSLAPTAADDGAALNLACRQSLRETSGPVLVLSNRSLGIDDGRLVQITSEQAITNVGIERLSVSTMATQTQAMVRLFNQSRLTSAQLTIRADGKVTESRQVSLPATGNKEDYFVDLPIAPGVVEADVDCDDSIKINHRAWLVRGAAWPIVEAGSPLPPEVTRMIQVYSRRRPASELSRRIVVASESQSLPAGSAAAILPDAAAAAQKISEADSLTVRNSPLKIQFLDWPGILAGASAAPMPAGDWRPIVSAGKSIIVATCDAPARRAWIGFQSEDFGKRVDFVVFWNAVFNWLGGGQAEYVFQPVGAATGHWTAGLYHRGGGVLEAVNATSPPIPAEPPRDWRGKLKDLAKESQRKVSLAGAALAAAAALAALAALVWPGSIAARRNILQS